MDLQFLEDHNPVSIYHRLISHFPMPHILCPLLEETGFVLVLEAQETDGDTPNLIFPTPPCTRLLKRRCPGGVLRKVGCVWSKEVGGLGSQAASAIAMRVQAKRVAAGILESKRRLGVDGKKMDVDEEQNVHALRPLSHHLSRRWIVL